MIESIETAKSDRSSCKACKKTIEKGMIRGIEEGFSPFGGHPTKHYYCLSCTYTMLQRQEEVMKAIISEVENALFKK